MRTKHKTVLGLGTAAIFLTVFYLYVPAASLSMTQQPKTRERLLTRVHEWIDNASKNRSGRRWEMESARLREDTSKLQTILYFNIRSIEWPMITEVIKSEMIDDNKAKVFLIEYYDKRKWTGNRKGEVELWVYEKNDWYRDLTDSAWVVQWNDEVNTRK